jgi:hypothetical protein
MVPPRPTAAPVSESKNETACRLPVLSITWIPQVSPASVVRTMTSGSPTAMVVWTSRVATAVSSFRTGLARCTTHPGWANAEEVPLSAINHDLPTTLDTKLTAKPPSRLPRR